MSPSTPYTDVGPWSEIKLDIVREYAQAYSRILVAQQRPPLYHVYIDAFAGAGLHRSRTTGEFVLGSPLNALFVDPPFREYHFIDLDDARVEALEDIAGHRPNVHIYHGDCNELLREQVFPKARYQDYRRALCLLDPYGLHLTWEVIEAAGKMRSVDLFLNFPVADMNRNVLWRNPEGVSPDQLRRMDAYWGDDSWKAAVYTLPTLFGDHLKGNGSNGAVAEAFRKRLKSHAGFAHVPEPMPMRNSRGATVYYLFFASQKPVASGIVEDIFRKYRERGGR